MVSLSQNAEQTCILNGSFLREYLKRLRVKAQGLQYSDRRAGVIDSGVTVG